MNLNKIVTITLLSILIVLIGCEKEAEPDPPDEDFAGTYMVRDLKRTMDEARLDSLILKIRKNTYYTMFFYGSSNSNYSQFCDVEGTILDFGTGKVSFDPTNIIAFNCDTLRIPRGLFEADFRNHGDTVYIFRNVQDLAEGIDSLYIMKLIKKK